MLRNRLNRRCGGRQRDPQDQQQRVRPPGQDGEVSPSCRTQSTSRARARPEVFDFMQADLNGKAPRTRPPDRSPIHDFRLAPSWLPRPLQLWQAFSVPNYLARTHRKPALSQVLRQSESGSSPHGNKATASAGHGYRGYAGTLLLYRVMKWCSLFFGRRTCRGSDGRSGLFPNRNVVHFFCEKGRKPTFNSIGRFHRQT